MLKKKYDFVTIGGATRDFMFYDPEARFLFTPDDPTRQRSLCFEYGAKIKVDKTYVTFGGGAANAAVNLARQGYKTAALVSLGDDDNGEAVLRNFRQHGVDASFVAKNVDKMTGYSFILTAGEEREHVIFLYRGANVNQKIDNQVFKKMKSKWFYVASLSGAGWIETMDKVVAQKSFIAWNPGGRQIRSGYQGMKKYLGKVAILAVNKDEAIEIVAGMPGKKDIGKRASNTKFLLKALQGTGPEIVVITSGDKGADSYDGKKYYHQKALMRQGKLLDTTGVGDCFNSTFVAGLERYKGDVKRAMLAAAKNAAAITTKVGAQNGFKKVL